MADTWSIGVVFPGDAQARGTWSGTPAGIAGGLAELGLRVRRIDARAPRALDAPAFHAVALGRTRPRRGGMRASLRSGRAAARVSPAMAALRSAGAAGRLRAGARLDAVVQIGTGYTLPAGVPLLTYEDMTVPQAVALGYPGWDALPARAVRARMERQRRAYERAVACCTATTWAARSIVADYGIDPAKVHAVGIGRNHEVEAPADRDWTVPRFLFVAMDWAGKNGPGVLRAFERLRAEIPGARLDVVGAHPALGTPGVTGYGVLRMEDAGDRVELGRLYRAATCFVMPSHREAAGIAYLEAAAAGLSVIGSSAGGARDLIAEGGCVVDPADGEALLAAMRRLADPGLAAQTGERARRHAEPMTWRAVAERIAALAGEPVTAGAHGR